MLAVIEPLGTLLVNGVTLYLRGLRLTPRPVALC